MTDPFDSAAPAARPARGSTAVDMRDADAKRDGNGKYLIPPLPKDYKAQFAAKGYATPDARPAGWTRATTFAKSISDTFTLSAWSQRMAVKGLATRPDLVVAAAAARVDDKATLDDIVNQAKDAAAARARANLGTAVHSLTEADDRGELPDLEAIPKPYDADVRAWRAALAAHRLTVDPQYIERSVLNTRWGVAGSFDRLFRLADGSWVVGDLKTGRDLQYGWNEIAIQLVIYALADAIYDWSREVFLPMPEGLRTDKAYVVHLPAGTGRAEVYRVNLDPDAVLAADLCAGVRKWRSTRNLAELLTVVDDEPALFEVSAADHRDAEDRASVVPVRPEEVGGQTCPACGQPVAVVNVDSAAWSCKGCDSWGDNYGADVAQRAWERWDVKTGQRVEEPAQETAKDAQGGPLGPLAGPGERGCSVCRRKGHKRGSPKCWKDQDPAIVEFRAKAASTREPVPAGVIACGPNGAISQLPAEDAATVQAFADELETVKACSHTDGWTRAADAGWCCAKCGAPGAEPKTVDENNDTEQDESRQPQAAVTELEDGGDPFADEPMPVVKPKARPRPPTDLERIQAASSLGELAKVGKELAAAGKMTDELKAAGKARRAQLSEPGA